MEFRGQIRNGVVVFEVTPPLPDGTNVTVHVADRPDPVGSAGSSVWERLMKLAGTVEGPPDWAANHDHYLYGTPKR